MADGFEHMVDAAQTFFAQLQDNNSKDWFAPRKDHYTAEIKKPAELFGSLITEDLTRITGQSYNFKLFRIYRDVRFSKDKSPLNAHLHLMWSDPGKDPLVPSWFFGLSPSYFILGTGMMGLQGAPLTAFRAHIDTKGDALAGALQTARTAAGAQISDWGPEPLKKVPKPYGADHPHGDLLRRKALAVTADIPGNWRHTGLVQATCARIKDLWPVARAMRP